MNSRNLLAALGILCAGSAQAQIFSQTKKEPEYQTPTVKLGEKLHRKLTEDEVQTYMYQFSTDTMPSDVQAKKDVVLSETTPFRSRRSVWADATMPARAGEFGRGKFSQQAISRPSLEDRRAASQLPETDYPGKQQNDAILAAVYRHFFDYRAQGFGKTAGVYFLGLGPHKADAPPSLVAALKDDPTLKRDKVRLQPISKSLEVTNAALRDRDTGADGVAFRVDDISPEKDGEVHATATYSERDGLWFTRDFTLRQGKSGWTVVADNDYALK